MKSVCTLMLDYLWNTVLCSLFCLDVILNSCLQRKYNVCAKVLDSRRNITFSNVQTG